MWFMLFRYLNQVPVYVKAIKFLSGALKMHHKYSTKADRCKPVDLLPSAPFGNLIDVIF